jgi:hypothetical protein
VKIKESLAHGNNREKAAAMRDLYQAFPDFAKYLQAVKNLSALLQK